MQCRPAGPVALLLQSLGAMGLTIDAEANTWGPFGEISIIHAPLRLYRTIGIEAAVNGITSELHSRRPRLAPAKGVDWSLTRALWTSSKRDGAGQPSGRHLLAMAAGGHWRQHRIQAIEPNTAATCMLCGQGRDDDGHMWECPELEHVRKRHSWVTQHSTLLPISLRAYGIAPPRAQRPDETFLGRRWHRPQQCSRRLVRSWSRGTRTQHWKQR